MKHKIGLVAAALAMLTAFAGPADAAGARACLDQGTVTFMPALTPFTTTGGSMKFDFSLFCAGGDTRPSVGLQSASTDITYTYNGSCIVASFGTLTNGGVLVGGAVGARVAVTSGFPLVGARTFVLVPEPLTSVCNMTVARLIAVGADVAFP